MNFITLPQAVLVSLPTVLDLKHAALAYGAIVGCALSLYALCVICEQGIAYWERRQSRKYVIERLMLGDRRKR